MTSTLLHRWRLALTTLIAALVVGGIAAACGGQGRDDSVAVDQADDSVAVVQYDTARAPAPGKNCPTGKPPSNAEELRSCLENVRFDSSPLVSDSQALLVVGDKAGLPCPGDSTRTCRYGPVATIQPVIGSHVYSERDLREGRIIARLRLVEGSTESYAKFGLTPGRTTYWWVQKSSARGGASYYVTLEGRSLRPRKRPLEVIPHPPGSFKRAVARWIWTLDDEKSQGTCGSSSSCR